MRSIVYTIIGIIGGIYHNGLFASEGVTTTGFMFEIEKIFPSPSHIKTDKGIDNVKDLVIAVIPILSIFMAIAATVMVIFGGIYLILGGVSTAQTDKGKEILKNTIIGVIVALVSYLMIVILGNILDV